MRLTDECATWSAGASSGRRESSNSLSSGVDSTRDGRDREARFDLICAKVEVTSDSATASIAQGGILGLCLGLGINGGSGLGHMGTVLDVDTMTMTMTHSDKSVQEPLEAWPYRHE